MALSGKGCGSDPEDLLLEYPAVEAVGDGFVEDAHCIVSEISEDWIGVLSRDAQRDGNTRMKMMG